MPDAARPAEGWRPPPDQIDRWHSIPGFSRYEFRWPDRVRSYAAGALARFRPVEKKASACGPGGAYRKFALTDDSGRARGLTPRRLIGLVFGPEARPAYRSLPACPHCGQKIPRKLARKEGAA